jgi:hypothetical protein
MQEIDFDRLREDLIDYFGTAMFNGFHAAVVDVTQVEMASNEQLIQIAQANGFNLNNYIKSTGFKL